MPLKISALEKAMIVFKLVLLGDSNVGKTSIFESYVNRDFPTDHRPTLGVEFGVRTFRFAHSDQSVKLQLWDTAGHERFKTITRSYYRGASMIALVYDLTRRKTFLALREWVTDVQEVVGHLPPMLLIGNKLDRAAKGEREVTEEDVGRFVAELGAEVILKAAEVSAKTGEGIESLFEAQIKDLVRPGPGLGPELQTIVLTPPEPNPSQTPVPRRCCSS